MALLGSERGDSPPTRSSLLGRLRAHEDPSSWQQGWREFFECYHGVIYRYAIQRGLTAADAEDIVQDTVIGVAKSLPSFRYDPAQCRFKTWLFRIARNKVNDQFRLSQRERYILPSQGDERLLEDVEDEATLAPDAAWDAIFEGNLRRAALERVSQRVQPMTMRLYLYHVVDGHDVPTTVHHFRESRITSSAVHLAKHRVQVAVDKELDRMHRGGPAA